MTLLWRRSFLPGTSPFYSQLGLSPAFDLSLSGLDLTALTYNPIAQNYSWVEEDGKKEGAKKEITRQQTCPWPFPHLGAPLQPNVQSDKLLLSRSGSCTCMAAGAMPEAHGPHDCFRGHLPPDLRVLLDWLDHEGVEVHPSIQVEEIPGTGWGVIATGPLRLDEAVLRVPKPCVLSHRTSSLSIPKSLLRVSVHAAPIHTLLLLSLCVMHEMRLGKQSRWYGYLQSLPRDPVMIPLFWGQSSLATSEEERQDGEKALVWLKSTDAARDLDHKAKDGLNLDAMRAFFEHSMTALLPTNPPYSTSPPFASFLHAFSLVSTRAFVIDMYHTIALVPFADILNHSTRPHTALQSDQFVCHVCGALGTCEHDVMNADGIARRLEDLPDEYREELERAWRAQSARGDTVDMLVEDDDVQPGQQVFNSYGADIPNARLLVEWGFVLEDEAEKNAVSLDPSTALRPNEEYNAHHQYLSMAATAALRLSRNGLAAADSSESESSDSDEDDDEDEDSDSDDAFDDKDPTMRSGIERLLHSPQPTDRPVRCVSSSGLISIGLFVDSMLVARSAPSEITPQHTVNIARMAGAVFSQCQNGAAGVRPRLDNQDVTWARDGIANLLHVLEDRLASLHCSSQPLEELQNHRNALPHSAKLQNMAMALCLSERRSLEGALRNWQTVLHGFNAG